MEIIVLPKEVAEAISDILHRIEGEGFIITELEDMVWARLTHAIQKAIEVEL